MGRQCFTSMSAFNYNKSIDYRNDSHVSIGNMNTKCNFCRAFKWPKEPPGLCSLGEKFLFTGGPRYMQQRKQDAMVYVRNFGRPDLFITMTCNS